MEKEILISENMNIIKHLANKFCIQDNGLEYSDLINTGVIGLIEAIDRFDESKGMKFSSYAYIKIKASIIDEIRKNQLISKYSMAKIKNYKKTVDLLTHNLNRTPSIQEKCSALNISKKELSNIELDMHKLNLVYLNKEVNEETQDTLGDLLQDKDDVIPSNILEEKEKVEILSKSINSLREKEQLVLSLYYYEELNLKEIGKAMNISESRVSQIHRKAICNLKQNIKQMYKYDIF